MCHDRTEGDELVLTHDFLSMMLGVQRAGVTLAIQNLEGAGRIRAKRRRIEVLDRAKLLALTNGSYGTPEASMPASSRAPDAALFLPSPPRRRARRSRPDPEGDELAGPEEARAHALMVARDLIARVRLHAVGDWFTCSFEVADEDGHTVTTVPFSETVTEENGD